MTITRNSFKLLFLALLCISVWGASDVSGEELYAPDLLWERGIAEKTDPVEIADTHLWIPYRDDGALDHSGHFTTFDRPDELYDTPGLNCSGLVASVCRFLFNKNWDLASLTRDQQGNSGPGSALGKDWDFGWDLILNLTAGSPRRVLTVDGSPRTVESVDALNGRGFDLHDIAAWRSVLAQMKPGYIYLGSISKPSRKPGYKVLHYHVVLVMPDKKGNIWLYHSTRRSSTHKMNVNSSQGLERFMSQFRSDRVGPKNILIVEAKLPDLQTVAQAAPNEGARWGLPEASTDSPPPIASQPESPVSAGSLPGRTEGFSPQSTPTASSVGTGSDRGPGSSESGSEARPRGPGLVIAHRSGKVFKSIPDLVTHLPTFAGNDFNDIKFWFRNRGQLAKNIELLLRTPDGDTLWKAQLPGEGTDLSVRFPQDFDKGSSMSVRKGTYLSEVRVDGERWCVDAFEVTVPREAEPRIMEVQAPSVVESGRTFSVKVVARNRGAESDYGGITVSSPDPAGLKLVAANPGKIYGPGSTVLSVTSDKIRTKVPMAERWINLWGENKSYDMEVRIQAGRAGTYPLYVRCALRGVNVKSSVVLMDPDRADTADQQGFPVQVYQITVR